MKNKNLILLVLAVLLCLSTFTAVNGVPVQAGSSVYTVEGDTFDSETGELSYRKVSYSTDTNGEYVSYPCKYEGKYLDDTCVSIKYKNSGVTYLPVYMEFGAGINEGGVDYAPGEEIVCMDMFDNVASWNVSYSKSVDGYDVATISFGSYTSLYHDMILTGFRLYFDNGKSVNSARIFEVYGLTVHEKNATPSFASDPKPCRIGKITASGTEFVKNSCTVNGESVLTAPILDFDSEYKKLKVGFTLNNGATVSLKLDGEVVSTAQYGVGSHLETLNFVKDNYEKLEIEIIASDCKFQLDQITLVSTPFVDTFSGSHHTITKQDDGSTTVTYTYKTGWNSITAPIRRYTSDYDGILIELLIDTPVVLGLQIDDQYLYSHWSNTTPLEVGDHSFFFSLAGMDISDSSLVVWLDPAITGYAGVEGTKTVIIKNIEFKASSELPKATISGLASEFNFTYDGKGKKAEGATTNSGEALVYEYKLSSAKDSAYDTDLPVDAGEYDVRVTSPSNTEYSTTYAYAKLIIAKANAPTPTASCISIDYVNSVLIYDPALYAVSRSQDFSSIALSGSGVLFGDVLYVKYIESNNYFESQAISVTLDKREGEVTVTVNYQRELTVQNIEADTEYSKDGLNWTVGSGKKVTLEPGNIYLFRKKATASSFAGSITYLAINYRPQAPAIPELVSTTSNSITLEAIPGAEYRLADTVWQADSTFTGLKNGSKVTVFVRIKGTANRYASEEVSATFTVGKMPSDIEDDSSVDSSEDLGENPDLDSSDNSSQESVSNTTSSSNGGTSTPNKSSDNEEKGCGSSLIANGGLTLLALVASAVCITKKRREE